MGHEVALFMSETMSAEAAFCPSPAPRVSLGFFWEGLRIMVAMVLLPLLQSAFAPLLRVADHSADVGVIKRLDEPGLAGARAKRGPAEGARRRIRRLTVRVGRRGRRLLRRQRRVGDRRGDAGVRGGARLRRASGTLSRSLLNLCEGHACATGTDSRLAVRALAPGHEADRDATSGGGRKLRGGGRRVEHRLCADLRHEEALPERRVASRKVRDAVGEGLSTGAHERTEAKELNAGAERRALDHPAGSERHDAEAEACGEAHPLSCAPHRPDDVRRVGVTGSVARIDVDLVARAILGARVLEGMGRKKPIHDFGSAETDETAHAAENAVHQADGVRHRAMAPPMRAAVPTMSFVAPVTAHVDAARAATLRATVVTAHRVLVMAGALALVAAALATPRGLGGVSRVPAPLGAAPPALLALEGVILAAERIQADPRVLAAAALASASGLPAGGHAPGILPVVATPSARRLLAALPAAGALQLSVFAATLTLSRHCRGLP